MSISRTCRYAQKNNFPILYRVTLPRTGAMHVIIDTLRPEKIEEALENEEVTLIQGCLLYYYC